jgi:hypothetical protein
MGKAKALRLTTADLELSVRLKQFYGVAWRQRSHSHSPLLGFAGTSGAFLPPRRTGRVSTPRLIRGESRGCMPYASSENLLLMLLQMACERSILETFVVSVLKNGHYGFLKRRFGLLTRIFGGTTVRVRHE